jgi:hypothetical protein
MHVGSEGLGGNSPPPLRYYLDEHLPPVIAEQLRARGIVTLAATEAGRVPVAITDEDNLPSQPQTNGRLSPAGWISSDCRLDLLQRIAASVRRWLSHSVW